MGLEAWGRGGAEEEKEEEKEKEKIPHMCESIDHRPLQGRCPAPPSISSTKYTGTADHLTLLRLLLFFSSPAITN